PDEGVGERLLQVEVEGLAEDPRFRPLGSLAATRRGRPRVPAEGVATEAREEAVEDLLADAPAAPRRELEPPSDALGVAGLLERAGQLLQPGNVLRRVGVEQ